MDDYLQINDMSLFDIDEVKNIEEAQGISILTKDAISNDLQNSSYKYLVLKLNENIIGYVACSVIIDTMDILSIVIDKNFQQKGYATYLLKYLINYANSNDICHILLEVRKSNQKAINLYQKLNFKKIYMRKAYYANNMEDAYIFELNI